MRSRRPLDRMLERALSARAAEHRLRSLRTVIPLDSTHVELDGRRFINFSSNDYLGLSRHPELIEAVRRAAGAGVGSAASPLITGHTDIHASAESALAEWKGYEAAVLLPSGYQANHAAVQALAALGRMREETVEQAAMPASPTSASSSPSPNGRGVRFLVDKLAHASLLDAIRASDAPFRVFSHNHLGKLRRLLEQAAPGQLQVIVTESIFSMDGDAADLEELAELKRQFDFVLLLDEAHATGTYGPDGSGYAAEKGLGDSVDVSIVTLSKALGCMGGAVCGSRAFIEAVANYGRSYIYSTSLSPVMAAAVEAAVGVVRSEPERRERVRALARRVREGVGRLGFGTLPKEGFPRDEDVLSRADPTLPQPLPKREGGRHAPMDSPIIPVVLGSEAAAVAAERMLRDRGLLVIAVRPPSVAPGSSRLRITVSCAHDDAEIDQLLEGLGRVRGKDAG